jgi:hypothetical protein
VEVTLPEHRDALGRHPVRLIGRERVGDHFDARRRGPAVRRSPSSRLAVASLGPRHDGRLIHPGRLRGLEGRRRDCQGVWHGGCDKSSNPRVRGADRRLKFAAGFRDALGYGPEFRTVVRPRTELDRWPTLPCDLPSQDTGERWAQSAVRPRQRSPGPPRPVTARCGCARSR